MTEKEYMADRQKHFREIDISADFDECDIGWIDEAEEAFAFYQVMKQAEKYCHEFFSLLCSRDGVSANQPLPLVFRTKNEAMIELMSELGTDYFGSFLPGTMQKGEWGNLAINITIPISMDKDYKYIVELPSMIKLNMRHELIHYYLYLRELPSRDNDGLFWAYCYTFDGGAYEPLSEKDQEKYERFVNICEKDGADASFADLQNLAEAIMLDDEIALEGWNMMIEWRKQMKALLEQ